MILNREEKASSFIGLHSDLRSHDHQDHLRHIDPSRCNMSYSIFIAALTGVGTG